MQKKKLKTKPLTIEYANSDPQNQKYFSLNQEKSEEETTPVLKRTTITDFP